jgi:hypothetical protein
MSVNSAIVRELGQPWQKKTGAPVLTPYSESATDWPPLRLTISGEPVITVRPLKRSSYLLAMPDIFLTKGTWELHRNLANEKAAITQRQERTAPISQAHSTEVAKLISEAREMRSKCKKTITLDEI